MADERDPKLSQHYQDLEALEPSRELDQTILAAARRATGSAHAPLVAPSGRHRWYYSLAAAAVLVFAVALTMHIERQQPDPEAAAPPPAPTPKAETRGVITAKPADEASAKRAPEAAPPAAPAEPARAPAFAPEPPPQAPAPRVLEQEARAAA